MYKIFDFEDEEAWKKGRFRGVGGSDAAALLGLNPYKSNLDLFEEKTGRKEPPDISEKDFVKYGHEAEPHIRALFALDYPEYKVEYHPFRILQSIERPYMLASLDGELTDKEGRRGILEIKTTNILQSMQKEKWDDQIPQNYYCQLLWYFSVTGYDFAVLRAHLRSIWKNETRTTCRHYFIEREEVKEDIALLEEEAAKFWRYVEAGRKPALILPEI